MALKNAKALLKKLESDSALQNKFRKAGSGGFAALSKEVGLECTVEEMRKAVQEALEAGTLDEKILEKISGGYCCASNSGL